MLTTSMSGFTDCSSTKNCFMVAYERIKNPSLATWHPAPDGKDHRWNVAGENQRSYLFAKKMRVTFLTLQRGSIFLRKTENSDLSAYPTIEDKLVKRWQGWFWKLSMRDTLRIPHMASDHPEAATPHWTVFRNGSPGSRWFIEGDKRLLRQHWPLCTCGHTP